MNYGKWKKNHFKRENIEPKIMKNEMQRVWSWTFAFDLANAFIKLGLVRYLSCYSSIQYATCLHIHIYRYYTTMPYACDDFRGWRLTLFRHGSPPSLVLHPYVNEWETDKSSSLLGFYGYFDIYNCIDTVGGYFGLTSMPVLLYLLGIFFFSLLSSHNRFNQN